MSAAESRREELRDVYSRFLKSHTAVEGKSAGEWTVQDFHALQQHGLRTASAETIEAQLTNSATLPARVRHTHRHATHLP